MRNKIPFLAQATLVKDKERRASMKSGRLWSKTLCITLLLCLSDCFFKPNSTLPVSSEAHAASRTSPATATPKTDTRSILTQRKDLFEKASLITGVPWYYFAAIDQYERSLAFTRKRPAQQNLLGIYISETDWAGALNPDLGDTNPISIAWFHGVGRDGSGDGVADRNNPEDLLSTVIAKITRYGRTGEDFQIGLWEYYHNSRSVTRINQFAQIYARFGTLDLLEHAFPLPIGADYTYKSTWGASRGWGGYRVHEGTDLFARYGLPVRSTCFGIIEIIGWNVYGGWRFGIRDLNGVYHYYAHLSAFNKKIKEGDIVYPGQLLGWVGNSGYGKPGTSGKFPPHLHYGLYRDHGLSEWSFDPYPYLRQWEREERLRQKNKRPK
jgi:murein DD-endopeptidase MepM/ murein hydrolase activator NlpD